jgi:hypothetical protein
MERNINICKISIGGEESISINVINKSTHVTKLCDDTYQNRETMSLHLGIPHFNPPQRQDHK